MITVLVAAGISFIQVTTPGGATVDLNPREIITLRPPREDEHRGSQKDVRCLVFTADAKFVSTLEDCHEIRQLIRELGKE